MTTSSRPAILFDLYGVLLDVQTPAHLRAIEKALGADDSMWEPYWKFRGDLDAARLTLADYWSAVAAEVGAQDYDLDDVVAADIDSWMEPKPATIALARELIAEGYQVALLSNIPTFLAEAVVARHDFLQELSPVVFSCEIGHAKPEADAYRTAAEQVGRELGDIIFFDDNEHNVHAARDVGMQAHVFHDVQDVRNALTN